MSEITITMPKMGEGIIEAEILEWLKNQGDTIEADEPILEVATDKVDTEIPSMYTGVLKKILTPKGAIVKIGDPIALLDTIRHHPQNELSNRSSNSIKEIVQQETATQPLKVSSDHPPTKKIFSPLVRNVAKKEKISLQELERITGTGLHGRVTKNDLQAYLWGKKSSEKAKVTEIPTTTPHEIIEMDRMRKLIATRMVASKKIAPHVTSFVEADVTNLVQWRHQHKKKIQEKYNIHFTYTPIFIGAIAKAIQDFPMINTSVDGNTIIKKKEIHIGLAVALPNGNLIVPVIKNANHLSLLSLAQKINQLAQKARSNQLIAEELTGATYTVSNIGSFGNLMGTPIIMQPQVAILALGAIVKKPAVIETPQGDTIGIRHTMFLSHAYDHRVIDGMLGGMFAKKVADYLTNFDIQQSI